MRAILIFSLFIICACSPKIHDSNTNIIHLDKSKTDLTVELRKHPRVIVFGDGRLAKIRLRCGSKPSIYLNDQLEIDYSFVYDKVKDAKLKTIRVQNLSDAALLGLRAESSNLIILETE